VEKSKKNPILVMVVDDSAVVRGLVSRMLDKDDNIEVVDTVSNGELAVKRVNDIDLDVIILDIEMPVMDGLTALPKILEINPNIKVIMASTLTMKNAEISLKALQAGAADYIAKPTTSREMTGGQDFEHDLCERVKALGIGRPERSADSPAKAKAKVASKIVKKPSGPITLRPEPIAHSKPKILAVGSSTGGPQALFELFKGLSGKINVPIVVTQHMPPTFTTILAQHITRTTGIPAEEAQEGSALEPGKILIAPGDFHMILKERGDKVIATLNQDPPVNYCRPAVDPMFESVVKIYGKKTLGVILTGMGYDGRNGSKTLVEAGGVIFAQDEESSVVWGMPGAVAEAGICSAVLPITQLAPRVLDYFSKGVG
jgi:two-component system, chemotaxis family, protein-glutamate methylesterase/glutaminase